MLSPILLFFIIIFALLDAVLKIISLWKSARANQIAWFVCLAIFNTLAILPAIYLLFFQKKAQSRARK